jgi:hypothetical protein
MSASQSQPHSAARDPRALGLRLPRTAAPGATNSTTYTAWCVVERVNGCFHVSREARRPGEASRTEALLNAVGRTKVFRVRAAADLACSQANQAAQFAAEAARLAAEPMLGGVAA